MRTVLLDTRIALWLLTDSPKLPATIRQAADMSYETISDHAIFMLGKLPQVHRDRFDRLLAAHGAVGGWELATVDERLMRYPIRIWR